ncbi:tRNA (5-methylaminomethyl-2-thiouridine)(34)-methyltransferase MnmD [Limnospira platensis]|uniref:tRNA (5-methylaminomethyl-2-thiouridine)(34)-methyltransferase MnmD n=1 Tax=Limnospira platensis TaxID=118562 RepID=UPI003D6ED23D
MITRDTQPLKMMSSLQDLPLQPTEDGSFTFFSPEFGEAFHSRFGAKGEAQSKFVEPLNLAAKATAPRLKILDICYGLGYNTAAALAAIWEVHPNCQVEMIGLELDQGVPQRAIAQGLLNDYPLPIPEYLKTLGTQLQITSHNLQGKLLIGDARETLKQVYDSGFQADAICLDPFSPPTCPGLWTVEFLAMVAQCLKPDGGRLATYSCAAAVRTALMMAGLAIASSTPFGRRAPGTIASWDGVGLPPLTEKELEQLNTRAAIPYRDPNLGDRHQSIIERRQTEQAGSPLEPSSHWKKRWISATIDNQ